jgi:2-polyprenyl-3-methyl-5-hydroxy-6-metoxy-1,4-benzoquinol methylase
VSWFEAFPEVSLRRVRAAIDRGADSVIDVGGGASMLVDHLLQAGVDRIAVLDISEQAIDATRTRLGENAERVEWIVADVVDTEALGRFDVWHDRATFHFLTDPLEQTRYVALCEATVTAGGTAVMATFDVDGPTHCSGLPVSRYDASELADRCGPGFGLIDSERRRHLTPAGVEQRFLYASFRRAAGDSATR